MPMSHAEGGRHALDDGSRRATATLLVAALLLTAAIAAGLSDARAAGQTEDRTYVLYVAAESDDVVEKVAFGPDGFRHLRSIPVGIYPTEIEGPHGLAVAPDGRHWYVTIAHGNPYGTLFKYTTEEDEYVDDVTLGLFPATLSISPSTGLLFAVNFNLHGDPEPSTVSVVETGSMAEVAQIPVGVMPHGSRMDARGAKVYTVMMMDDELWELDAYRLGTSRVLPLSENAPHARDAGADGERKPPIVKPTWATSPTGEGRVYVAGNGAATILEVDVDEWKVSRRFRETGRGPYNLDVDPDGRRLVATYKGDQAVGIWDLERGVELARLDTLRPVPHGVVVSPDGRYAFVSIEGVGGEPGSVEAFDLASLERAGSLDVAKQAGGIVLWETR